MCVCVCVCVSVTHNRYSVYVPIPYYHNPINHFLFTYAPLMALQLLLWSRELFQSMLLHLNDPAYFVLKHTSWLSSSCHHHAASRKNFCRICAGACTRLCCSTKKFLVTTAPICTSKRSNTCLWRRLTSFLAVFLRFLSALPAQQVRTAYWIHSPGECMVVVSIDFVLWSTRIVTRLGVCPFRVS